MIWARRNQACTSFKAPKNSWRLSLSLARRVLPGSLCGSQCELHQQRCKWQSALVCCCNTHTKSDPAAVRSPLACKSIYADHYSLFHLSHKRAHEPHKVEKFRFVFFSARRENNATSICKFSQFLFFLKIQLVDLLEREREREFEFRSNRRCPAGWICVDCILWLEKQLWPALASRWIGRFLDRCACVQMTAFVLIFCFDFCHRTKCLNQPP